MRCEFAFFGFKMEEAYSDFFTVIVSENVLDEESEERVQMFACHSAHVNQWNTTRLRGILVEIVGHSHHAAVDFIF